MSNKVILNEEGKDIFKAINDYDIALDLLDQYDHQCLVKPSGKKDVYKINYKECRQIIDAMKFDSEIFGVENYLNPSEQSLLVGLLTSLIQENKFSVFNFSEIHLTRNYNWHFFKKIQIYGIVFFFLYTLCILGITIQQMKTLSNLGKAYEDLCYIQKESSFLKKENK